MDKFTYIKKVTVDYTLGDLIRYTTRVVTWPAYKHRDACLAILSDIIKANRWELLRTLGGYKIITNGYKQFKRIEITGSNRKIPASEIFNRISNL